MSRTVGTIAAPSSVACGRGGAEGRTSSFDLDDAHGCIPWTGRGESASRGTSGGARDVPGVDRGGRATGGRASSMRWYFAIGIGSLENRDTLALNAQASARAAPLLSPHLDHDPCSYSPSRKRRVAGYSERADECAEEDVVERALRDGDLDGGLRPRGGDAEGGGSSG
ncbi:hypothetical protein K438DRAFT_1959088 [Mycena galopus ATCC 62051]|nr:hypothetical protein K438DRAFT_1959088 [Mycena galopus ATCC 62051]